MATQKDPKGKMIDVKLHERFAKDAYARRHWTSQQFASALCCDPGTVRATRFWKALKLIRSL